MTELYLKHTFLNFLMEKMQKYLGQIFCRNAVTQIISFITFIAILYTLDKVVTLCKLQKHQKKLEKLDVQRKYLHENLYKEVGNKYLMPK